MSAPLWTAEFLSYRDALAEIASMTEDDLRADVDLLPDVRRERLAAGPLPARWSCGVCKTFSDFVAALDRGREPRVDLSDPEWRVFLYHEEPKARMKRRDQLHYGPLANEQYERGIATYRAAGWDGDAAEPNA